MDQFGFEHMNEEERVDFYRSNGDKYRGALESKMQEIQTQITSRTSKNTFSGEGEWADEKTLLTRYSKEEVENIKANANHMEHPTRKVRLYEDMNFKTAFAHTEKREDEWKRQCTKGLQPQLNNIKYRFFLLYQL